MGNFCRKKKIKLVDVESVNKVADVLTTNSEVSLETNQNKEQILMKK